MNRRSVLFIIVVMVTMLFTSCNEWFEEDELNYSCVKTFTIAPNKWISEFEISPNGNRFFAEVNNVVYICDFNTGNIIDSFPNEWVSSCCWSPDGNRIVVGYSWLELWDANSCRRLKYITRDSFDYINRSETYYSLNFNRNGTRIAGGAIEQYWIAPEGSTEIIAGPGQGFINIWDVNGDNYTYIKTIEEHTQIINDLIWSPDGNRIVTASGDSTLRILDVNEGRCLKVLKHKDEIWTVAANADFSRIASGSCDGKIKIWNPNTGECVKTINGHNDYIQSLVFSPDGKYLVSGSTDKTMKIWDVNTGDRLQKCRGFDGDVRRVRFTPDGKYIVTASYDGTVKVWSQE